MGDSGQINELIEPYMLQVWLPVKGECWTDIFCFSLDAELTNLATFFLLDFFFVRLVNENNHSCLFPASSDEIHKKIWGFFVHL